jgi:hypothetical protein
VTQDLDITSAAKSVPVHAVTLTVHEIAAIHQMNPSALPPGLGYDDAADIRAGILSLVARELLPIRPHDPHPLGPLFGAYGASTRRLAVDSWTRERVTQASLHVGTGIGVLHVGSRTETHRFHWVGPDAWRVFAADLARSGIPIAERVTDSTETLTLETIDDDITGMCTITAVGPVTADAVQVSIVATDALWFLDGGEPGARPATLDEIDTVIARIAAM